MSFSLRDLSAPIIGAPMAGGPSTPALVGGDAGLRHKETELDRYRQLVEPLARHYGVEPG